MQQMLLPVLLSSPRAGSPLVLQADEALVTNLSLLPIDQDRPTACAPWHEEVTTHMISKVTTR